MSSEVLLIILFFKIDLITANIHIHVQQCWVVHCHSKCTLCQKTKMWHSDGLGRS